MEQVTDITMDDCFVIHVLDNRLPAVQCSQALTPLPQSLRVMLKHYVLSLLKPRFRRKRYGRFQPQSIVRQHYQRLLAHCHQGQVDTGVFLATSQALAAALFDIMRRTPPNGLNGRPGDITPGDLLMGLLHVTDPEPLPVPWLYIIKVDLDSALQREMQPYDGMGIQTVLTRRDGLIPKLSAAHVHKSALIRFADDPTRYDVLMTDPQAGKHGIAKFFAADFLATEPFFTADEQAELLFMRAHAWVTEHEETLSPQERLSVLQSVRTLLVEHVEEAEPLLPQQVVEALPLLEPRAEIAVQQLRHSFEEALTAPVYNTEPLSLSQALRVQTVPPQAARRRVTYQLDYGVQLSGDEEALERLFTQPPHRVGESTEFTIRSTTFRPVF